MLRTAFASALIAVAPLFAACGGGGKNSTPPNPR